DPAAPADPAAPVPGDPAAPGPADPAAPFPPGAGPAGGGAFPGSAPEEQGPPSNAAEAFIQFNTGLFSRISDRIAKEKGIDPRRPGNPGGPGNAFPPGPADPAAPPVAP
ncbi:MAG: hypothetical protein KDA79_18930, partial [Planctomycetaceae bacterium]|nr:hypothetical protein [Planctomycetaceae bacterium]